MTIKTDSVAAIHYTLKDNEGEVIDTSEGHEPLAYLHGHAQIVPGLEQALEGKSAGDTVSVVVDPEQGYGLYEEQLVLQLPIDAFPEEVRAELEPGVQFLADHPSDPNQAMPYTVVEMQDDTVIVDGNHPLADIELHFDIEIVEVRDASAEELLQGYAGPAVEAQQ